IRDDAGAPAAGPDSLWRVYSMSKPITGMSAMMLIEDGKLNLDDPVSKYIPAFKDMKVATSPDTSLATRPATRPITIRNLLTHTAGLGYTIVTKGPLLKEYERLGILPLSVSAAMEEKMRPVRPKSLEEFANRVATLPLIADPGTKWSYSIGLDVMGRVAGRVASDVSGLVATFMFLNAGIYLLTGSSRLSLPSSTSIIADMPVIGLDIE
ncbi:MAG: class A beta-lactamase-related serine hydrolase, partial [Sphingomonas sp.]